MFGKYFPVRATKTDSELLQHMGYFRSGHGCTWKRQRTPNESFINGRSQSMNRSEMVVNNMQVDKMNCAQSILAAYCEELGLKKEDALRIAMGFGGGMGYTGGICGAVTGAYMVIGLKTKITDNNLPACKEKAYALVQEFDSKFKKRHPLNACGDLLGYDLRNPELMEAAKTAGIFAIKCPGFLKDAVEILESLTYE
jgi:C_GCAxxG_C_C family probable redox protein